MKLRWEGDERGAGIADGKRLAPGANQLVDALSREGWVAEQPEAHLLPHLERHCARPNSPLELIGSASDPDGTFVVELRSRGASLCPADDRRAVFALLGEIAESATYVRQRREPAQRDVDEPAATLLTFEVVTGMLAADTAFASHGHTLILRILPHDE